MNAISRFVRSRGSSSTDTIICRLDGSSLTVRLRLLGYDDCEFECEHALEPGELVKIKIHRMGSIRARIISQHSGLVVAEFAKECPV